METIAGDISGGCVEAVDTDVFIHRRNSYRTIEHLVLLQIFVLFDELAKPRVF